MVLGRQRRANRRSKRRNKKEAKNTTQNAQKQHQANKQAREEKQLARKERRMVHKKSRQYTRIWNDLDGTMTTLLGGAVLYKSIASGSLDKSKAAMAATSRKLSKSGKKTRSTLSKHKNPFTGEYREWYMLGAAVAGAFILRNILQGTGLRQSPPPYLAGAEYAPDYSTVYGDTNVNVHVANSTTSPQSPSQVNGGASINLSAV